jgi:hypothetical protein
MSSSPDSCTAAADAAAWDSDTSPTKADIASAEMHRVCVAWARTALCAVQGCVRRAVSATHALAAAHDRAAALASAISRDGAWMLRRAQDDVVTARKAVREMVYAALQQYAVAHDAVRGVERAAEARTVWPGTEEDGVPDSTMSHVTYLWLQLNLFRRADIDPMRAAARAEACAPDAPRHVRLMTEAHVNVDPAVTLCTA